jgi:hypothetical protein
LPDMANESMISLLYASLMAMSMAKASMSASMLMEAVAVERNKTLLLDMEHRVLTRRAKVLCDVVFGSCWVMTEQCQAFVMDHV